MTVDAWNAGRPENPKFATQAVSMDGMHYA